MRERGKDDPETVATARRTTQTVLARTLETMSRAVGMEIREHKSSFAVYVVLRMLVLAMAILQFFNGDYENVFLCILTLLLLLAPAFIQVQFRIELPSVLEVIVLVFVFSAEILGEISSFYEIFRSGTRCCIR